MRFLPVSIICSDRETFNALCGWVNEISRMAGASPLAIIFDNETRIFLWNGQQAVDITTQAKEMLESENSKAGM